jgi:very-short-patch-repair endonuclease
MQSSIIAKKLRKNLTDEERILWSKLKNRNFYNLKFRRQYKFDKYILDFVCLEKNFIIELDGSQHGFDYNKKKDILRDNYLASKNFKVLRFWNDDVRKNLNSVLETMEREIGLK